MAKKKAARSRDGNVPFQVRVEPELHDKLKKAAEHAELSLNQLVTGILRGAVDNMQQGEGMVGQSGFVWTKPMKKCLYFGRPGHDSHEERRNEAHFHGGEEAAARVPAPEDLGEYWFGIDYTGRGYMRKQGR